jgi:hypothetical protein
MPTLRKSFIGVGLVLALAAAAVAQESGWTKGLEIDANSKYIWRSLAWSEGAVLQPSAWVGTGGFTFSVWSNFVLNSGEANAGQFNEVDFRLSYDLEAGDFTITPAFNVYVYPNQDPDFSPTTGELEIAVAYAIGSFSLETAHFFDVMDNQGGYIGEVGLAYEADAADGLTLAAAVRFAFANAKFNQYYVMEGLSGSLMGVVLEAGLTYTLSNGLYIRPHLEYNNILDKSLREAVKASEWLSLNKPSLFNFGFAVGFEF